MNPRKRVFIFPCGSEIGLELNRALAYSTHFEAVGGGSVEDHGAFAFDHFIGGLSFIDDPALLPRLREVFESERIDLVMPAHDSAVLKFAEWEAAGELGDVRVVGSPLETCRVARSKAETYRRLKDVVPVPQVFDSSSTDFPFPVFLKPDVGQGSRGTHKAPDAETLAFHLARNPDLLVCEHLPGPEFTIDCFTDRHGELRYTGGRIRRRISNGISVGSAAVNDPRFEALARAINAALPFRGQWFFQLKERASGELVLLEIAPRAAGASGFARAMGVNLPLLSLHDALDRDVAIAPNRYQVVTDRALATRARLDIEFGHVFVDLDDTVLWDGSVNHRLLAVLHRFRAEGKKLHLITRHGARHADTAREALEAQAISPKLFDRIIEIPEVVRKSDLIDHPDAIFIDDSHAERADVANARDIPVFDINQIIELYGDFH